MASDIINEQTIFERIKLNYKLEGSIVTDGEFSFVSPLSVPIPGYDKVDSEIRRYYKFSGDNKLEEDGWNSIYSMDGDDDFVGEFYKWRKEGDFLTHNSIYTIGSISNKSSILTYIDDKNKDITISSEVKYTPSKNLSSLSFVSGSISAYLTGFSPIKYNGQGISLEIEYGLNKDNNGVIFFKTNNKLIEANNINWNNEIFNSIKIKINEYVDVYFNDQLINRFLKKKSKAILGFLVI